MVAVRVRSRLLIQDLLRRYETSGTASDKSSYSVESQGRTLEQLEWIYDQPNPVRASLKVEKVVVQSDGTVSEKLVEGDRPPQ